MKKIKKIGLGVASAGGLLIPLVVVASCSSQVTPIDYNINAKSQVQDIYTSDIENDGYKSLKTLNKLFDGLDEISLDNLSIIFNGDPTTSSKATITLVAKSGYTINNEETVTSKEFSIIQSNDLIISPKISPIILKTDLENNNYKRLETLEKVFSGINDIKLSHLSVSLEGNITSQSTHTIILTANEGYTINGQASLSSDFFRISNQLNIAPVTEVPTDITHLDIENENYKNIVVLQKLFSNISESDLKNLDISISGNPSEPLSNHTITLKTKNGFIFMDANGNFTNTIQSVEFTTVAVDLNITAISEASLTSQELNSLNNGIVDDSDLIILEKLFTGLDDANIHYFDIDADSITRIVTLTAKKGFTINGNDSFSSNQFTIFLEISRAAKLDKLTFEDIKTLNDNAVNNKDLPILNKLFDGIDQNNIIFIENIVVDEDSKNVTLTTKNGYVFIDGGKNTLTSNNFTILLKIEKILDAPIDITHLDIENENYKNIVVLQKLFSNINESDLKNLDISISGNPSEPLSNHIITLKAKNGFIFMDANGNFTDTIQSVEFTTVAIDLNITAISDAKISWEDFYGQNGEAYKSLETLQKLFSGIDESNKDLVSIDLNIAQDETGLNKISLKANNGYTINGLPSVVSLFKVTLAITNNDSIVLTSKDVEDLTDENLENDLIVLQKLFSGITQNYLDLGIVSFELEANNIVKLIAANGFIFSDGESNLVSNKFTIKLDITPNPNNDILLTYEDIENLSDEDSKNDLIALNKLFSGITQNYLDLGIVSFELINNFVVDLNSARGFVFANGKDMLTSKNFNTLIDITPITTAPIDITHLDIEGENYKNLSVLKKLFDNIKDVDLKNISVTMESVEDPTIEPPFSKNIITLAAGEWFKFIDNEGKQVSQIESIEFTTVAVNLNIIPKDNPNVDWEDIYGQNGEAYKSLETLQKLFHNINQNNINLITPSLKTPESDEGFKIYLEPQQGYIINTDEYNASFIDNIFLPFTTKSPEDITLTDLQTIQNWNGTDDISATLLKLFYGINKDNLLAIQNNINVDLEAFTVTLTPKNGFAFEGSETLISNKFTFELITLKEIKVKETPDKLTLEDIQIIKTWNGTDDISATLLKLFYGINKDNILAIQNNINVDLEAFTVTLTPKNGFAFEGSETLISNKFTFELITLKEIKVKDPAGKIKLTQVEIDKLLDKNQINDFVALDKLFNGIKTNYYEFINFEYSSVNKTITLNANKGYIFSENLPSLQSGFEIENIVLNLFRKDITEIINKVEIKKENLVNIEILKKFFDVSETNLNGIDFDKTKINILGGTSRSITLIAKQGYIFKNQQSFLISKIFSISVDQSESPLVLSIISNRFSNK